MKQRTHLAVFAVFLLAATVAWAEQDVEELIEHVVEACQSEMDAYCSQVTPGGGRVLACFYAHQDKLSGRCEYALYDTAALLEQFAAATTYLAKACRDDLHKFCSEVKIGEGRVGMCLLEHKPEVSEGCSKAMDDVELVALDE